ncbi:MAG: protease modulator HflC [Planctomycetes bacterium]|nr:protease modulator HflC [Planctomycetota bacterium]
MNLRTGRIIGAVVVGFVLIIGLLLFACTYTVSEGEQVVVTEFGKPVKTVKEPGLNFKKPFVQVVNRFEKRVLPWDGEPARMPTRDKKMIFIDTWARWRIVAPEKFFTACTTIAGGQQKLDSLVDSAVRDVVGRHQLIEVVRSSDREMLYEQENIGETENKRTVLAKIKVGREKMEKMIRDKVALALSEEYGIELVDVRIKRINYVETVRTTVYERMNAERKRIASQYESEAEEQRAIIQGETKKELDIIEGEGSEKSKTIRGEADAEAIRIYGEALSKDPEFYTFLRTLEAYRNSFNKETEIIFTTDSPFLRFMEQELDLKGVNPRKAKP